jgi:hypothetical protein
MSEPIMDMGLYYAGQSQDFLKHELGRDPTVQEFKEFAAHAVAALQAAALGIMHREGLQPESIEVWLASLAPITQTLARGYYQVPLVLKSHIQVSRMENHPDGKPVTEYPMVPPAKDPPEPPCVCVKGDGLCSKCFSTLSSQVDIFAEFMLKMQDQGDQLKALCKPCVREAADTVASEAFRKHFSKLSAKVRAILTPATIPLLTQYTQRMEWPLTEAALTELMNAHQSTKR